MLYISAAGTLAHRSADDASFLLLSQLKDFHSKEINSLNHENNFSSIWTALVIFFHLKIILEAAR